MPIAFDIPVWLTIIKETRVFKMIYSNKSVFPYCFLNLHKPHLKNVLYNLLTINKTNFSNLFLFYFFEKHTELSSFFGTCSLQFLRNFICKFLQHSKTILHRTIYFNLHYGAKGSLSIF